MHGASSAECVASDDSSERCAVEGTLREVLGEATLTQDTEVREAASMRIREVGIRVPDHPATKVFTSISCTEIPVGSHIGLQFTFDTGAEVSSIGLRQVCLLGLCKPLLTEIKCSPQTSAR